MEEYRALGRIIAHGLRNPMAAVREWLRFALETEDVSHVERALPALERLEELTDDLAEMMQSSDTVDDEREEIDVGDLAEVS
jgi:signal transduction histidine kinase